MNNENFPISAQPELLLRKRITNYFDAAAKRPMISIIAGTGYGKTQAVSMYLEQKQQSSIWIQLTALDNWPTHLWQTLTDAVSTHNKEFAAYMAKMGFPYTLKTFDLFIHEFARTLYKKDPLNIVLDDFHVLTNDEAIDFFTKIIYTTPEDITLFVISRVAPTIKISSFFNNNKVTIITENNLRFTEEEIYDLLVLNNVVPSINLIENIMAYTDGWALAVSLVCFSAMKGNTMEHQMLADITPPIYMIIEEEIFSKYSKDMQMLIIRLSLLDEIPVDFIRSLLPDKDKMREISDILNTNMFINYNQYLGICYFHYLFLTFLKDKQKLLSDQEIKQLYMQAGDWYLLQNRRQDAIPYYYKCGDEAKIFDAITTIESTRFSTQDTLFYLKYLNNLSEGFVNKNPLVRLIKGGLYLNNLEIEAASKELEPIIASLQDKEDNLSDTERQLLGEAYTFLGLTHLLTIDAKCTSYFQKAQHLLPNGSSLHNGSRVLLDNHNAIYIGNAEPGEIDRIVNEYKKAAPSIAKLTKNAGYGVEVLAQAEQTYFINDQHMTKQYAYQAIYIAKEKKLLDILSGASFLLIRSYIATGDYHNALNILESLKKYVNSIGDLPYLTMPQIVESWFFIQMDQPERIHNWFLNETKLNQIPPINYGRDRLIKMYYFLQRKDYENLEKTSRLLIPFYHKPRIGFPLLYTYIFNSMAHCNLGNTEEFLDSFQKAYHLAYNNDLIMPFIELGSIMKGAVESLKKINNHGMDESWLDNLSTKAATYAKRLAYAKIEHTAANKLVTGSDYGLTNKEVLILEKLCLGLTRDEIATSTGFSVNTVKSNLQSIYTKLGAVNLADAVRIAVSMKII